MHTFASKSAPTLVMCSYMYNSFSSLFCLYLILMLAIQFNFDYSSYAYSFISKSSPFHNETDSFSTEHINFLSYIFKCCFLFQSGLKTWEAIPNFMFTFQLQQLFYLFLCYWYNKYKHRLFTGIVCSNKNSLGMSTYISVKYYFDN